jgi:AAA domain-containing protein
VKPRLVMFEGPAGAGKSTLAQSLARSRDDIDLMIDHDIFERLEFADVARAYRTKDWPTAQMLLDAFRRVLERAERAGDVVVSDFSAVGLAEELPWAQPDRTSVTTNVLDARADPEVLAAHARDVLALAGRALLFVLDVPSEVSVSRAAAQRGDDWLRNQVSFVPPRRPGETRDERAVRFTDAMSPRREDIVAAHVTAGWDVVRLDAFRPAADVLREALPLLA